MKIALCALFMEADLWQKRLEGLSSLPLRVDEFNRPSDLCTLPSLTGYDGVWLVLDGAVGLETVARTRERDGRVPIVWVSCDASLEAVNRLPHRTLTLPKDCTDRELIKTLERFDPPVKKNEGVRKEEIR